LESIKAIEEEEKKLKDLNLVYILGLFLVVFVIGYTLFSQRKTLETIKRLSSK
jgi:choline-glycine betaine transporter